MTLVQKIVKAPVLIRLDAHDLAELVQAHEGDLGPDVVPGQLIEGDGIFPPQSPQDAQVQRGVHPGMHEDLAESLGQFKPNNTPLDGRVRQEHEGLPFLSVFTKQVNFDHNIHQIQQGLLQLCMVSRFDARPAPDFAQRNLKDAVLGSPS
jgi:hypothetical protein